MEKYVAIGCTRIENILRRMKIATMRTLEQKISDAGPYDQRIDPHHLITARKRLERLAIVIREERDTIPWYRLSTTPEREWREHLARVEPILERLHDGNHVRFVGKTLEVAVFRALQSEQSNHGLEFYGGFLGLESSDPEDWRKIEPPNMISGRFLDRDEKLDFVLNHPEARGVGIEVKNTREWIYPRSNHVRKLLRKCSNLDLVPTLICRRYEYATFSVLHRCGVVLHQNYNQLFPESSRDLADLARHKNLLGYHDIRVGHEPDSRLCRFFGEILPRVLPEARNRFDEYKDLLDAYANGEMRYMEFAARASRRERGVDEDFEDREDIEFE